MRELTEAELDAVVGGISLVHPGNVNPNASDAATDPINANDRLKGWAKQEC